MQRKIVTVVGIIVLVAIIAVANQWTRLNRISKEHLEMAQSIEGSARDRGKQPVSWDLFEATEGGFEEVPTFSTELTALEGKRIDVVGYGQPFRATGSKQHQGHSHASILDMLIPELVLSHAHDKPFQNIRKFMLLRYPLDCYHESEPLLNDVIYACTPKGKGIEFMSEHPICISGKLVLNRDEGPKFAHVLQEVQLLEF